MLRAWVKAAQVAAIAAIAASAGGGHARAQASEPSLSPDTTVEPLYNPSSLGGKKPDGGSKNHPPVEPDLDVTAAPNPGADRGAASGSKGAAPSKASGKAAAAANNTADSGPPSGPSAADAMAAKAGQKRQFPNFYELRASVLDAIGSATERIWLVTDYLTDGETVSALYIAQYRKIDVRVLLGRARANHYMSRLNYLKNQNIPVYLKPDSFKIPGGGATAIIVDNSLVTVDGELDFLAKYKKFSLSYGTPSEAQTAMAAFAEALNAKVPAIPHQLPLVGRHNPKGTVYEAPPTANFSGMDTGGAFRYDRKAEKRPSGVTGKLPKSLKWQQQQKND